MARLLHIVRIGRGSPALVLLWLVSLVLLAPPGQAARDVELRWIVPAGGTVDGYKVYLALQPGAHQPALDIGSQAPDANGVASATIHIGSDVDYYASMTAYNSAGESVKSNEIALPTPQCDVASCDDGNPCTLDACGANACTHAPLSGSTCNDGDPGTIGDVCSAGICQGFVPECTSSSQCSDQDACNGAEYCIDNHCVAGVPLSCPAPSQCTVGICQAGACGSTPVVDGLACNDGSSSTTNDRCLSGICIGQQSPPPDPDPLPDPDPDPVPDPDPLPVDASLRPVLLEALGTMAVLSVVGDSSFTAQAVVVPPTAAAVPLDRGLKIFNPTASVGMCEPEFCLATLLETDAKGKVTGAGSIELGTETIEATFKGKLKGKNGGTRVTQSLKLQGIIQGVAVKGSSKLRGDLDWNTGMFKFEARVKVCTSGSGCEEMTVVDAIALDPNDGLWTLQLDVVGVDATNVGGSAFATLGDGRTLVYEIQGKYSSKTDRWNLTLKGTGDDEGSSIKLKDVDLSGGKIQSGRITHKILGHRGVFEPIP